MAWFRSCFWPHGQLLGIPCSCLLYQIQSASLSTDFVRKKLCSCYGIHVSQLDAPFSLVCNTARFISDLILFTFSLSWFELFRLTVAIRSLLISLLGKVLPMIGVQISYWIINVMNSWENRCVISKEFYEWSDTIRKIINIYTEKKGT